MYEDSREWSQQMFGASELGDARRTRRLIDVAARLAERAGVSLPQCCEGDQAALQGSYRLINNDQIEPQAIAQAGFEQVARQARQSTGVLLAVQDSTSLSYAHEAARQLGALGAKPKTRQRGFMVHSVLLIQASSEHTLGLIEQRHWCRDDQAFGQKHARRQRPYEGKESYKWQHACERVHQVLGEAMPRTISVGDRESDVYEYLHYKRTQGQRFVVRAQADRRLQGWRPAQQTLFQALEGEQAWLYEATVTVAQRGGRAARQAPVRVCARTLSLAAPLDRGKAGEAVTVNVVRVCEAQDGPQRRAGGEPLNWILLTSEPVDTPEQVRQIVRYYELRWRIEEFHKAWKSGAGVERCRMQSAANLQRMLVITAFIAVRLLQLREHLAALPAPAKTPRGCEQVLSTEQWHVLWQLDQHQPLPHEPPSARWACLAIAKLAGFTDTKRTGRPGWDTLWHGWLRLHDFIEGFRIAQRAANL